jgi:hypothetical protein
MPIPHCVGCGTTQQGWWWWCGEHRVWECDNCSRPGAYRAAERSTHRFSCRIEGVKSTTGDLLVTWTNDRQAEPVGPPVVSTPG